MEIYTAVLDLPQELIIVEIRVSNTQCKATTNVTRFYKIVPNQTPGKIKLAPPVDSYTIVLLVLTFSTTQTTRGWF